jgi:hypothetical protein
MRRSPVGRALPAVPGEARPTFRRKAAAQPSVVHRATRGAWRILLVSMAILLCVTHVTAETQEVEQPKPPVTVTVTGEVDRTAITLGDPLTFTLRVEHDPAVEPVLPRGTLPFPGFEKVKFNQRQETAGTRTVEVLTWTLTRWELGKVEIPPVSVSYLDRDQQPQEARSLAIPVEVTPVLATDDDKLRAMKPAVVLPVNWRFWGLVIAFATALAAGAVAGIVAWRRRPRRERAAPAAPAVPCDQAALAALTALAGSDEVKNGAAEPVATRLSAIVRRFLEARLAFNALESTTAEMTAKLRAVPEVNPELHTTFLELLTATDQVKFARGWAGREELEQQIGRARDSVLALGVGALPVQHAAVSSQRSAPVSAEPPEDTTALETATTPSLTANR